MGLIKYKTSSPAGDLLALLPSIRQMYKLTGKKGLIYQAIGIEGQSLPDKPQAFLNEQGNSIMMSQQTFDYLIPLLKAQEYISDLIEFKGQPFDFDIDEIRLKTFTNQPHGSINRWSFYVFPEMACDLSKRWLTVTGANCMVHYNDYTIPPPDYSDKVILNYTNRYRNNWINYFFLKQYEEKFLFAGLPKEHEDFCKKWDIKIPLLEFNNFYELAAIMASCKLFAGVQSMMFQIAEGLKIPRLLEAFHPFPNVIPFGKNGYDYYHQGAAEYYFKKLIQ